MKTLLVCAVLSTLVAGAYSVICMSCAVGPSCNPVEKSCENGEGRCVTAWGTVNGVMQYYRGCAFVNHCDFNCTHYINGSSDCNHKCCDGEKCNAGPFPSMNVTSTQSANTTQGTPAGGNSTETTPTSDRSDVAPVLASMVTVVLAMVLACPLN
ncbi:uncharacterized protein LOC5512278 [Nematostella vectensis]|uniref:uncharacterized protein LOC5512278 n=1 Tax=Nematostella vectensis TaxID=45351 RepID=UPI002076E499|nr:uncharacterized protein LOC5512278 [Nematostella vectensis]